MGKPYTPGSLCSRRQAVPSSRNKWQRSGGKTDSECGSLFYQHPRRFWRLNQVLTDGGDLDMNLRFVTELFDDLDLAFKGYIGDIAGQ
ncbi:Uncharacterised protein [Klebsiella pneumoniae]|uniref:Uncharacterized protein n=1 Tax=Klebsiella pneumoniae TaxID=573 RepID=A0A447RWZ8_KLEPN|nr:Uncharacterised protein [Klebsiella pneumoniae]